MDTLIVLVLLVVVFVVGNYLYSSREMYTSAVITQLVAKDPQDTYLTGDAYKYAYPPYGSPYGSPYGYPGYDPYLYAPYYPFYYYEPIRPKKSWYHY